MILRDMNLWHFRTEKSINKTSSTLSPSDNGHIPGFSTNSCISQKYHPELSKLAYPAGISHFTGKLC